MGAELQSIALFIGIIIATILIAIIVNRIFLKIIKRTADDLGNATTNYQFLRHSSSAVIYILGFTLAIYSLPSLRAVANSLLAGAGIAAVAISFASQHALGNIVSGVFMVIFKPFRVGDRLTVRSLNGIVEDITLRHTVIRDFENKRILIPNAVISDEIIINADFVNDKLCRFVEFHISFDSDIDLAKQIMLEEVCNHPFHVDPRSRVEIQNNMPIVPVRVLSIGESGVLLRAWAWASDAPNGFVLYCDVLESIKKRFDREGVQIAFPYRMVVQKKQKRDHS